MAAPINVYTGNAVPRAQIVRIGPPAADQVSGRFEFTINSKSLLVEGWDALAIAEAWNALSVPEFAEIEAVAEEADLYSEAALILTGPEDGTPFEVSVSATGYVSVETIQQGESPINEVQTVTLPEASGGTWTISYDGQTTAAIDHDATAAAVQAALEALSNLAPGDVSVTGAAGGPYAVEFEGTLAGSEAAEVSADASGLTLDDPIIVATIKEGVSGQSGFLGVSFHGSDYAPVTALLMVGGFQVMELDLNTTADDIRSMLRNYYGDGWDFAPGTYSGDRLSTPSPGYYNGNDLWFQVNGSNDKSSPRGEFYIAEYPGGDIEANYFSANGQTGTAQSNEIQRLTISADVDGGTFDATHNGNTSSEIAWNVSPDDLETALNADWTGETVAVTGTAGVSYEIEFTSPANTNLAPMTVATGSVTASTGRVIETRAHDPGLPEIQRVMVPDAVTGGTFKLRHQGFSTAAIAYNASAATVEAALEAIASIGSGGATVEKTGARQWTITHANNFNAQEFTTDASGLTVSSAALVVLAQIPGGPSHWNDPLNWTLIRPPESGDEVWLDQAGFDVVHSLAQRCGISLHDADTDTLAADGSMHFAADQKITLRTDGTLPGGLAAGDYYVVDPDMANRIFKVSATRGGSPVDLTSGTGSGNHLAVVELDSLHVAARHSGALGLPRRNSSGYWEYRPNYLMIGFDPDGAGVIKVGEGDGAGSGLVRIDWGEDAVAARVVQTSGGTERGVPACLMVGTNDFSDFTQIDGDSGVAVFPSESSSIRNLEVRSGMFYGGEGLILTGDVIAAPGSLRGQYVDSAGNRHRLE